MESWIARGVRERREKNVAAFWAKRRAEAESGADRAVVEFNFLRGQIRALPDATQDAVWDELADVLIEFGATRAVPQHH